MFAYEDVYIVFMWEGQWYNNAGSYACRGHSSTLGATPCEQSILLFPDRISLLQNKHSSVFG